MNHENKKKKHTSNSSNKVDYNMYLITTIGKQNYPSAYIPRSEKKSESVHESGTVYKGGGYIAKLHVFPKSII